MKHTYSAEDGIAFTPLTHISGDISLLYPFLTYCVYMLLYAFNIWNKDRVLAATQTNIYIGSS